MKIYGKGYESKFDDYKIENVDEKEKYINEKLSKLPLHQLIKQIKIDELLWYFNAVSIYPSAIWDEKSIYLRIETGYAFTEVMNDELLENFNTGNFTQGSAILRIKCYNPKNLIVQQLPVREKMIKLKLKG